MSLSIVPKSLSLCNKVFSLSISLSHPSSPSNMTSTLGITTKNPCLCVHLSLILLLWMWQGICTSCQYIVLILWMCLSLALLLHQTWLGHSKRLAIHPAELGFLEFVVWGYSHSLLDAKINSVLSLCHDQAILNAVQSIIQNMIACEDATQQQLSYLQSEFVPLVPVGGCCGCQH